MRMRLLAARVPSLPPITVGWVAPLGCVADSRVVMFLARPVGETKGQLVPERPRPRREESKQYQSRQLHATARCTQVVCCGCWLTSAESTSHHCGMGSPFGVCCRQSGGDVPC